MLQMNLETKAQHFLFFSYFDVAYEQMQKMSMDKRIELCANKAYLDFNRTLRYAEDNSCFREKMIEQVRTQINSLIDSSVDEYDDNLINACNRLKEYVKSNFFGVLQKFTFGHAQKWINMTVKYMWLIGFWDEKLKKLEGVLHIPIDRIVLQRVEEVLEIVPDDKSRGLQGFVKVENRKCKQYVWSGMEDPDQYLKYQKYIRKKVGSPIRWENEIWAQRN